jgi:hypothetical protein
MMMLKVGVKLERLTPQMVLGHTIIGQAIAEAGFRCVITSGSDGDHMVGSLHYAGNALDYRTRAMTGVQQAALAKTCRERLGADFDVVLEADHLHVEYDPKSPPATGQIVGAATGVAVRT